MVTKLYEDFAENPEALRSSEHYWERLTTALADALGQSGEWRPWLTRTYADGRPLSEPGNPIWDGRSERLSRAFRIIQYPPTRDELQLTAWMSPPEEELAELPRDELVICLGLSEESASLAETLLRKWMTPETTAAEMKAFIEAHVPAPRHPADE